MRATLYISIGIVTLLLYSCLSSDNHREESKIFHAAPSTGGIGALYFALYDDNSYQICNSGGIGQDCYSGRFELHKDTLVLLDLNKEIPLKSNQFLIIRYSEQDSNYWKRKYSGTSYSWQDSKRIDTSNGLGDVYNLYRGKLVNDDDHFIIRLDNLGNYR
jgi:hypothetical protein